MKYFSIILTVMVTALIGRSTEPQTGWFFDQSTQQAFYILSDLTIDGLVVEGDGGGEEEGACNASGNCDVVGAFRRGVCSNPDYQFNQQLCETLGNDWNVDEEICIGWRYANSAGATTVPLMGKEDGINTFTYANPGDVAYLKVYDSSEGSTLEIDLSQTTCSLIDPIYCTLNNCNNTESDNYDPTGPACGDNTAYNSDFEDFDTGASPINSGSPHPSPSGL